MIALVMIGLIVAGCDKEAEETTEAFASRYVPLPGSPTLLTGATVLTGAGERLEDADVLMRDGRIVEVGTGLSDAGAERVDAAGKWITPGIIDVHSHLGVCLLYTSDAADDDYTV